VIEEALTDAENFFVEISVFNQG
jgi:hypothetical protein